MGLPEENKKIAVKVAQDAGKILNRTIQETNQQMVDAVIKDENKLNDWIDKYLTARVNDKVTVILSERSKQKG